MAARKNADHGGAKHAKRGDDALFAALRLAFSIMFFLAFFIGGSFRWFIFPQWLLPHPQRTANFQLRSGHAQESMEPTDQVRQHLRLFESLKIEDFIPVLKGLPELGDPFLLSMLHWCGIGQRPYPLRQWQVFLLEVEDAVIGVTGFYQRMETAVADGWIGWLGVVPTFRGRGCGRQMLALTEDRAASADLRRLLVYCDAEARRVHDFYVKSGYTSMGTATDVCPGQTAKLDDLVFCKVLPR